MKQDLSKYVDEVLSGVSLNQAARTAGVNVSTIRRALLKHPDYEKAKAAGKLHAQGVQVNPYRKPKLAEMSKTSPAVDEVLAGAAVADVAREYGIPHASLTRMVKLRDPSALPTKVLDPEVAAKAQLKIARRAIAKAEELMRSIPGNEGWVASIGAQLAAAEALAKPKPKPPKESKLRTGKLSDDEISDMLRDCLA